MATQPDNEAPLPEPEIDGGMNDDGSIGPGALATAGLGLIALAILIWFIYPRFGGNGEPAQPATAPATATTAVGELVTATPMPVPTTPVPTEEAVQPTEPPAVTQASPTPIPPTATLPVKVQEGVYARVAGTEGFGLRFRSGPGEDYVTWRILSEGEIVNVTGGPDQVAGTIWWRVVDRTGLVGWAAEQFLVPVEPPAWTPEPERTPDLTAEAATPEG